MASFEREKQLVERLLGRLHAGGACLCDPNANGSETAMDVLVHLVDGRVVGIQVTEIDPHTNPGEARSEEKRIAGTDMSRIYFGWGQNDAQVVLESLVRTIKRKVEIAARDSFESVDEVWLLVCGGIPEHGAAISTFVMTPWLSAADMGQATDSFLQDSRYDCCFFLPILGAEEAFYRWEKNRSWKKSVKLNDLREIPRAVYANNLDRAAAASEPWGFSMQMERIFA
jgi:hypothetical protein